MSADEFRASKFLEGSGPAVIHLTAMVKLMWPTHENAFSFPPFPSFFTQHSAFRFSVLNFLICLCSHRDCTDNRFSDSASAGNSQFVASVLANNSSGLDSSTTRSNAQTKVVRFPTIRAETNRIQELFNDRRIWEWDHFVSEGAQWPSNSRKRCGFVLLRW